MEAKEISEAHFSRRDIDAGQLFEVDAPCRSVSGRSSVPLQRCTCHFFMMEIRFLKHDMREGARSSAAAALQVSASI